MPINNQPSPLAPGVEINGRDNIDPASPLLRDAYPFPYTLSPATSILNGNGAPGPSIPQLRTSGYQLPQGIQQVQLGTQAQIEPPQGGGWAKALAYLGAGLADAGASLQGRQGTTLQTLGTLDEKMAERRLALQQHQQEHQAKINTATFEKFLKVSTLPRAQRAKLAAGFDRSYQEILNMPDAEMDLLSHDFQPYMQQYHPEQWKTLEGMLQNGQLNGERVKSFIDMHKDDLKSYNEMQKVKASLDGMNALAAQYPTIAQDASFQAKRKMLGDTLMMGDMKLQGTVEELVKKQQENAITGSAMPSLIQEAQLKGPQAEAELAAKRAQNILDPAVQTAKLKLAEAGASKTQNIVNAYTPASEEAQKKFMDSSRTTYDQLKMAPTQLANIEKAKALIPGAKGFMGPGGETLLEAAKFLNNRLGMSVDTQGVRSAEELRSRIFFNIMDNLKKMDAQPSQMQQQIMQESLGKLGTDPEALSHVLDAFGDAMRGKVDLYNQEVMGAQQRGVKFPYDPTIKLPPMKPVPQSSAPPAGMVQDGYRFKGGDPSKRENWEQVK